MRDLVSNPVSYYGDLRVRGNKIIGSKTNRPVQLAGMSFFWSNWSSKFWTTEIVDQMKNEFDVEILRAAYGIRDDGIPYNRSDVDLVRKVVKAAIDRGVYIIIDWHSHGAEKNINEAKSFFSQMAEEFGKYDNVIFELYNEPLQIPWHTIKSYAEQVIPLIRKHSDNLIIVGTSTWSQDVDHIIGHQIQDSNVAYALHFYAGTHGGWLRSKGDKALNSNVPLFVSECGSVGANGNGGVDYGATKEWVAWMNRNQLSWAVWAINDKKETSSIFNQDRSLTASGNFFKGLFKEHAKNAEWRKGNHEKPDDPNTILIEAENFTYMKGVQNENCSEGGQNVGYLDAGDWLSYHDANIPKGKYEIEFRVAGMSDGVLTIENSGGLKKYFDMNIPATNGWQNWSSIKVVHELDDIKNLGIAIKKGGFNINWIKFRII